MDLLFDQDIPEYLIGEGPLCITYVPGRAQERTKRLTIKKFLDDYKTSRGCSVCGYNEGPETLDFHHIVNDNNKIVPLCGSIEIAKEEIKKCVVLCANCHRIETLRLKREESAKRRMRAD